MLITRATRPWGIVQVWLPDELETDILGGTLDHATATYEGYSDLDTHQSRAGLAWLVRPETELIYPRADGSDGSFYPDIIIAHSVRIPPTEPYRVVLVGKVPELIIEVLSPKTDKKDLDEEKGRALAYAQLGVGEYVTFDPRPRLDPSLIARCLGESGRYEPILPAPEGGFWLESLALRVVAEPADEARDRGPRLRFFTATGDRVLHVEEEAEQYQAERRARLAAERERVQAQQDRDVERQVRLLADEARVEAETRLEVERQVRLQVEQERDAANEELRRLRVLLGGGATPAPGSPTSP